MMETDKDDPATAQPPEEANRCVAVLLCKAWQTRERGPDRARANLALGSAMHHWATTDFLSAVSALERVRSAALYDRVEAGVLALMEGDRDAIGRLWALGVVLRATTPPTAVLSDQARAFRSRVEQRRGGLATQWPVQVPPGLAEGVADGLYRFWKLATTVPSATQAQIADVETQIRDGMTGGPSALRFLQELMRVHVGDTDAGAESDALAQFRLWRAHNAPDVAEWWPFETAGESLLYGLAGIALAVLTRVAARRLLPERANSLLDRALGVVRRTASGLVQAMLSWRMVGSVAAQLVAPSHVPFVAAAGLAVHVTPRGLAVPGVAAAQHPITIIRGAAAPTNPVLLQLALTFLWYVSPLRGGFDGGVVQCATDTVALLALTTAVSEVAFKAGVWGSVMVLGATTPSSAALLMVGVFFRGFVAARMPDPRIVIMQRRKLRAMALGDREHDAAFASEAVDDPDGHGYRPVYIQAGIVTRDHAGSLIAPLSDEDTEQLVKEIRSATADLVRGLRQARRLVAGGRLDSSVTAASPCSDVIVAAADGTASFSGLVAQRAVRCLQQAIAKLDTDQKKYLAGTAVGRVIGRTEAVANNWAEQEKLGQQFKDAKGKAMVLKNLMTLAVVVEQLGKGVRLDSAAIRRLLSTSELTLRRDKAESFDWLFWLVRIGAVGLAIPATMKSAGLVGPLYRDARAWFAKPATVDDLRVVSQMPASTVIPLLAAMGDAGLGGYVDPVVTRVLASRPVSRSALRQATAGIPLPAAYQAYLARNTPELSAYGLALLVGENEDRPGSGGVFPLLGAVARAMLSDLSKLPPAANEPPPTATTVTPTDTEALAAWITATQEKLGAVAAAQRACPAADAPEARQRSAFPADVVMAYMDPYLAQLRQGSGLTAAVFDHISAASAVITSDLFRAHPEALASADASGTFAFELPPRVGRPRGAKLFTSKQWTPGALHRAEVTLQGLAKAGMISQDSAVHTIGDGFVTQTADAGPDRGAAPTQEQIVAFLAAAPEGVFFSDLDGVTLVAPPAGTGAAQVRLGRLGGPVQGDWAVRLAAKELLRANAAVAVGSLGGGANPFGLKLGPEALPVDMQGKLFAALLTPGWVGAIPKLVPVPAGIQLVPSADTVVDGRLADLQKDAYAARKEVVTDYACIGSQCFYKVRPYTEGAKTAKEALAEGNHAQVLAVLISQGWSDDIKDAAANFRKCRMEPFPVRSRPSSPGRRLGPVERAGQTADAAAGRIIVPVADADGKVIGVPIPKKGHTGIGVAELAGVTPEQAVELFGPLVRLVVGARVRFSVGDVRFLFDRQALRPVLPARLQDLQHDGDVVEQLLDVLEPINSPEARVRLIEEAHDAGATSEAYQRLFEEIYARIPVPPRVRTRFDLGEDSVDTADQTWFRGSRGTAVFAAATRLRLDMGRKRATRAAVVGQLCSRVFPGDGSEPATVCQKTAAADASTAEGAVNFASALEGLLSAMRSQSPRHVQLAVTELDFTRSYAGRWRFATRVAPVPTVMAASANQHNVFLNALAEPAVVDALTESELARAVALIARYLGPNFSLPHSLAGRVARGRLADEPPEPPAERPDSLPGRGLPTYLQTMAASKLEAVGRAIGALMAEQPTDRDVRLFVHHAQTKLASAAWDTPVLIDGVWVSKAAQIPERDPDQSYGSKAEEELDGLARGLPPDVGVVRASLVTLPAYGHEKLVVRVSNLPVGGDQATAAGFVNAAVLALLGDGSGPFQDSIVSLVQDAKNRGYVLSPDTLAVLTQEDGSTRVALREARFADAATALRELRDFALSMPLDAAHLRQLKTILGVDPETEAGTVFEEGRVEEMRAALRQPRVLPDGVRATEVFTRRAWFNPMGWFNRYRVTVEQKTQLLTDRVQNALRSEPRTVVPLVDIAGGTLAPAEVLSEWRRNPTLPGLWYVAGQWTVMLGPKHQPADGALRRLLGGKLRADAIRVPLGTTKVFSDVVRPTTTTTHHQDLAAALPGIGVAADPRVCVVSGVQLIQGGSDPGVVMAHVIEPAMASGAPQWAITAEGRASLKPRDGPLTPDTFTQTRVALAWLVQRGAGELADAHGLPAWLHEAQGGTDAFKQVTGAAEAGVAALVDSREAVVGSVGTRVPVLHIRVTPRVGSTPSVQVEDARYLHQTVFGMPDGGKTIISTEKAQAVAREIAALLPPTGSGSGWTVGIAPGNIVYVGPAAAVPALVVPPAGAGSGVTDTGTPLPGTTGDQSRLIKLLQRPPPVPAAASNRFFAVGYQQTLAINGWLRTSPVEGVPVMDLVERATADAAAAMTSVPVDGAPPLAVLDGKLYGKAGLRFFTDRRVYEGDASALARDWHLTIAATFELLPEGAFPVLLSVGESRSVLGYFVPERANVGDAALLGEPGVRRLVAAASDYAEVGGASVRSWHTARCVQVDGQTGVCGLPFPPSTDTPPLRLDPIWTYGAIDRPPHLGPRLHSRQDEALNRFLTTEFGGRCFRLDHAAAQAATVGGLGGVTSVEAFGRRLASFECFDSAHLARGLACPLAPVHTSLPVPMRTAPDNSLDVEDAELKRLMEQDTWRWQASPGNGRRVRVVRPGQNALRTDPFDFFVFTDPKQAAEFVTEVQWPHEVYAEKASAPLLSSPLPYHTAAIRPDTPPAGVLLWHTADDFFEPLNAAANGCPLLFKRMRAGGFSAGLGAIPALAAAVPPGRGLVLDGSVAVTFVESPQIGYSAVVGSDRRSEDFGRAYGVLLSHLAERHVVPGPGCVLERDAGTSGPPLAVLIPALRSGHMDVRSLAAVPTSGLEALGTVAARAALRARRTPLPADRARRALGGWDAAVTDRQQAVLAEAFLSALQSHAVERDEPQLLPVQFGIGPDDGALYLRRTAEDAEPGFVDLPEWTTMPAWYPIVAQLEAQFNATALFASAGPGSGAFVVAGVARAMSEPRHRMLPMSNWIGRSDRERLDADVAAAAGLREVPHGDAPARGTLTPTGMVFDMQADAVAMADRIGKVEEMRAAAVNQRAAHILTVVPPRFIVRPVVVGDTVRYGVVRHDRLSQEGLGYLRVPTLWGKFLKLLQAYREGRSTIWATVSDIAATFFTDPPTTVEQLIEELAMFVKKTGVSLDHMSIVYSESEKRPLIFVSGFNTTDSGVAKSLETLLGVCGTACASQSVFAGLTADPNVTALATQQATAIERSRRVAVAPPVVRRELGDARMVTSVTTERAEAAAQAGGFYAALRALQGSKVGSARRPTAPTTPTFLGALRRPVAMDAMAKLGIAEDHGKLYERMRRLADATAILVPDSQVALGKFDERSVVPPAVGPANGGRVYMLYDADFPVSAALELALTVELNETDNQFAGVLSRMPLFAEAVEGGAWLFHSLPEGAETHRNHRADLAAIFPFLADILGAPAEPLSQLQRKALWYAAAVGRLSEDAVPAFVAWAEGYGFGGENETPDLVRLLPLDERSAAQFKTETPSGVHFSPSCMADPEACVAGLSRAAALTRGLFGGAVLGRDVFVHVGPQGTRLFAPISADSRRISGAASGTCPAADALESFLPEVPNAVPAFPQSVPPESAVRALRVYFDSAAAVVPEGVVPREVRGRPCVTLETWPGHAVCGLPFRDTDAGVTAAMAALPAGAVVSPFGEVPGMPELTAVFMPREGRLGTVGALFDTNPAAAASVWGPATTVASQFEGVNPLALRVLGGTTLYVHPLDLVGRRRTTALSPDELMAQFFPRGVPLTGSVDPGPAFVERGVLMPPVRRESPEAAAELNRGPTLQAQLDAAWRRADPQTELPAEALVAFAQLVLEEASAAEASTGRGAWPPPVVVGTEMGDHLAQLGRALMHAADDGFAGAIFPDIHSASSILAAARALVDHSFGVSPGRLVDPGERWRGLFIAGTHLESLGPADAAARFLAKESLRLAAADPKSQQARALRVAAAFLGFAPKAPTDSGAPVKASPLDAVRQLMLLEKMIDTNNSDALPVHEAVVFAIRTLVTANPDLVAVLQREVPPNSPLVQPLDTDTSSTFAVPPGLVGAAPKARTPTSARGAGEGESGRWVATRDPLGEATRPSENVRPRTTTQSTPVDVSAARQAPPVDIPAEVESDAAAVSARLALARGAAELAKTTQPTKLRTVTVPTSAPELAAKALRNADADTMLILVLESAKDANAVLDAIERANPDTAEGVPFVLSAKDDGSLATHTYAVRNGRVVDVQYVPDTGAPAALFENRPPLKSVVAHVGVPVSVAQGTALSLTPARTHLLRRLGSMTRNPVFAPWIVGPLPQAAQLVGIPRFLATAFHAGQIPVIFVEPKGHDLFDDATDRALGGMAMATATAGSSTVVAVWDELTGELRAFERDPTTGTISRVVFVGVDDARITAALELDGLVVQRAIAPPGVDSAHASTYVRTTRTSLLGQKTRSDAAMQCPICALLDWPSIQKVSSVEDLEAGAGVPVISVNRGTEPLQTAFSAFARHPQIQEVAFIVPSDDGSVWPFGKSTPPSVYVYSRTADGPVRVVPLLLDVDFGIEQLARI